MNFIEKFEASQRPKEANKQANFRLIIILLG